MKKILYVQAIHPAGMDLLREKYEVAVAKSPDKEEVMKEVKDASAIVSRLSVIDRDIIDAAEKLEAIAKNGVGVDNIDVAYATEKGIPVLTTGQANLWSAAEHTVFAMGALLKRITYYDARMRETTAAFSMRRERPSASSASGGSAGTSPASSKPSG